MNELRLDEEDRGVPPFLLDENWFGRNIFPLFTFATFLNELNCSILLSVAADFILVTVLNWLQLLWRNYFPHFFYNYWTINIFLIIFLSNKLLFTSINHKFEQYNSIDKNETTLKKWSNFSCLIGCFASATVSDWLTDENSINTEKAAQGIGAGLSL